MRIFYFIFNEIFSLTALQYFTGNKHYKIVKASISVPYALGVVILLLS